jgi:hypothetical protein
MGLAGMEDAQIKSGNGMVDRAGEGGEMANEGMSVSDYAKMRQASVPGNEIYETQQGLRNSQKKLRSILEGRVRKLAKADMRYQ